MTHDSTLHTIQSDNPIYNRFTKSSSHIWAEAPNTGKPYAGNATSVLWKAILGVYAHSIEHLPLISKLQGRIYSQSFFISSPSPHVLVSRRQPLQSLSGNLCLHIWAETVCPCCGKTKVESSLLKWSPSNLTLIINVQLIVSEVKIHLSYMEVVIHYLCADAVSKQPGMTRTLNVCLCVRIRGNEAFI